MTDHLRNEELLHLQKRARRRLVGAVVLVLFAVIVLWNLLDATPPLKLVGDKVVVTSQASSATASISCAATAPQASAPVIASAPTDFSDRVPEKSEEQLPDLSISASTVEAKKKVAIEQKPAENKKIKEKKSIEKKFAESLQPPPKKDQKRILEGFDEGPTTIKSDSTLVKYSIQVAAYSDGIKAQNVINKLKAAGIRVGSEKIINSQGEFTRVRVGPYASRTDAEAALKKMQGQGVNGILVAK